MRNLSKNNKYCAGAEIFCISVYSPTYSKKYREVRSCAQIYIKYAIKENFHIHWTVANYQNEMQQNRGRDFKQAIA